MKPHPFKKTTLAIALSTAASLTMAGGAFDLSLTSDMVRVEHEAVLVGSGALFTVGGLFTQSDTSFLSAGFNGVDTASANVEWNGGLGAKAFLWNAGDSGLSVAVGGFARFAPASMNGLGFEGSFYMSPGILSFGEADGFQEMILRMNYKILPQGRVFVGYNDVSGQLKSGANKTINNGMHVGFRFKY